MGFHRDRLRPTGLMTVVLPFLNFTACTSKGKTLVTTKRMASFRKEPSWLKNSPFAQVSKHPDGSLDSASGRGYFPSTLNGLDVMVKDSKRYSKTNDWGFFTFGHHAEPYESAAKESSQCAYCHIANVAKTDMVWVQYYPLLKSKID